MKMEKQSTSPKDEDILSQTQDPLERRRLQNRLSQRNHRRKIRERIAKLQERVIANELRAAAAINGWDQPYNPSTIPRSHPISSESDNNFTSRDVSPLISDQCSSFIPPYPLFSSQSWPNDDTTFPQHGSYPGDLQQFIGASESSTMSPSPISRAPTQSTSGIPQGNPGIGGVGYHEMMGSSETLMTDPLSSSAPNQPLYYVATEAALPQIIQVINTMSPQYKVIVLVAPESPAAANMSAVSSPTSACIAGHIGMENGSAAQQTNPQSLGCLCYSYNVPSNPNVQPTSRPWMSAGQYTQVCPLHKMPNSNLARGFSCSDVVSCIQAVVQR
ncbi:hypothetical protein N7475_007590 [Penicillium sp. IBT 31633x]|nr:hypothetical protein N7475_007590 [Penicillium sp. IBT 31633x]